VVGSLKVQARLLIRLFRHEEAIPLLRKCIESNPKSTNLVIMLANSLHETGNYKDELPLREQILKEKPTEFLGWESMAQCHMHNGMLEEALTDTNKARALFPNGEHDIMWFISSDCLDKLKRFDESVVHIEHALRLRPRNARYLSHRAVVLQHAKRNSDAHEAYTTLINKCLTKEDKKGPSTISNVDPHTLPDAYYNRGTLCVRMARNDQHEARNSQKALNVEKDDDKRRMLAKRHHDAQEMARHWFRFALEDFGACLKLPQAKTEEAACQAQLESLRQELSFSSSSSASASMVNNPSPSSSMATNLLRLATPTPRGELPKTIVPVSSWTVADVCAWLLHIGPAYAQYQKLMVDQAVDGAALCSLFNPGGNLVSENEMMDTLRDLGIVQPVHLKIIAGKVRSFWSPFLAKHHRASMGIPFNLVDFPSGGHIPPPVQPPTPPPPPPPPPPAETKDRSSVIKNAPSSSSSSSSSANAALAPIRAGPQERAWCRLCKIWCPSEWNYKHLHAP